MVDVPLPRRKARLSKWLAWFLGPLLMLLGLGVWLRDFEPRAVSVERSSVWVGRAQRGDMVVEVQARGRLVPRTVFWVTASCAGRVEEIAISEGDTVQLDSLLVRLSNPALVLEMRVAEQRVAAASSQVSALREQAADKEYSRQLAGLQLVGALQAAQLELSASQRLLAAGVEPRATHDQLRVREQALSQQVDVRAQAQHTLTQAQQHHLRSVLAERSKLESIAQFQRERVSGLSLRAPMASVVSELHVEPGQWVTPGATVAKLVQPTPLDAELLVAEGDAPQLAQGQGAVVEWGTQRMAATVERIAPSVQAGRVAVELDLETDPPAEARPDTAISGRIELSRLSDVVYVERPTAVLPHTASSLFKLDEQGNARRTVIHFGRSSARHIEVVSGLAAGEQLILSDISKWDDQDHLHLN